MADFDLAIGFVLAHEGSTYTDDPNDAGGATKYGITLATLRSIIPSATKETVMNLTENEAKDIYRQLYWRSENIDSQAIGTKLFDTGVNVGVSTSIKMLQKALVSLGYDISVDGKLGPMSISTINSVEESDLMSAFCAIQETYYWDITLSNVNKKASSYGWPEDILGSVLEAISTRDLDACKQLILSLKHLGMRIGNLSFIRGWVSRANDRFGI